MKNQEMISDVWNALHDRRGQEINRLSVSSILKELYPELSYEEYKEFVTFYDKRYYSSHDISFVPEGFGDFLKNYITAANPPKALIPYATGLECDCFAGKEGVDFHFYNKDTEQATVMFADIHTIEKLPEEGNYDLIASALPLGPISKDFISCQIVEKASKLISSDGHCIFTFGKGITLNSARKWLSELEGKGLYCTAIIDMAAGSYAPISMVESEIVIFSKRKSEKLFIGLLADKDYTSIILDNYLKGKPSTGNPQYGIYAEGNITCYSDFLREYTLKKKLRSLSKTYNGRIVKIKDIAEIHAPDKSNEFQENEKSVFIPRLGNSPVVTAVSDFHIKPQNYFQIIVNEDSVLPRYLAFFLNSEDGVSVRQLAYTGVSIKAFNMNTLGDMAIPCPSIELQSEYLKTYDQLEALRVEVEAFKTKLQKLPASYESILKGIKGINNTGDTFGQWLEKMPYPIATILKRYSVAEEANTKQEILFYFFEAYSIFSASILSSALNKDVVDCNSLREVNPDYFEKASFGNWVRMDRTLSNLYLHIINDSDGVKKKAIMECFKTNDENLIRLLCNRKVNNILEKASIYRNNWKGHSGITGETIYAEHANILGSLLTEFQDIIKDLYERIRLIRPVGLSFSNGTFFNKVEIITGSNSIFQKETIKSVKALDNSKLYLQMQDTGDMLELPPYFIMKNSPADIKNACYFYNKTENGNSRYVSYHFDGKPEDIEEGETAFDHIKQLLSI